MRHAPSAARARWSMPAEIAGVALMPALPFRVPCHFWHFGHQNVDRPFWVKRFTTPLHPAV
jgi:hypothetical protein